MHPSAMAAPAIIAKSTSHMSTQAHKDDVIVQAAEENDAADDHLDSPNRDDKGSSPYLADYMARSSGGKDDKPVRPSKSSR